MKRPLVTDELCSIVQSLLSAEPPKPKGGRPRLSDRAVLTGILFVLRSGIPWEMLPQEMGCGSGVTCWRRLRDWQEAGVWSCLHQELLQRLHWAGRIDWSRACMDSASGTNADSTSITPSLAWRARSSASMRFKGGLERHSKGIFSLSFWIWRHNRRFG